MTKITNILGGTKKRGTKRRDDSFLPKVVVILLEGVKEALGSIGEDLFQFLHQVFHFFPLCVFICGAGGGDYREAQLFEHVLHVLLRQVDQGTDHGDA